jgi:segregation and condensation protein A
MHQEAVSVTEQAGHLLDALERRGVGQWATFTELVGDCRGAIEIVGRFLALLELYRLRAVAFDQSEPLGVLQISWTGDRPKNDDLVTADARSEITTADARSEITTADARSGNERAADE